MELRAGVRGANSLGAVCTAEPRHTASAKWQEEPQEFGLEISPRNFPQARHPEFLRITTASRTGNMLWW